MNFLSSWQKWRLPTTLQKSTLSKQSNYNPFDFLILTLKVIIQHCPNKINNDSPNFSILTLEVNRRLSLPTYLVDIFVISTWLYIFVQHLNTYMFSHLGYPLGSNLQIRNLLDNQNPQNIQETGEGTNPSPFLSLSIMPCLDAMIYGPCKYT